MRTITVVLAIAASLECIAVQDTHASLDEHIKRDNRISFSNVKPMTFTDSINIRLSYRTSTDIPKIQVQCAYLPLYQEAIRYVGWAKGTWINGTVLDTADISTAELIYYSSNTTPRFERIGDYAVTTIIVRSRTSGVLRGTILKAVTSLTFDATPSNDGTYICILGTAERSYASNVVVKSVREYQKTEAWVFNRSVNETRGPKTHLEPTSTLVSDKMIMFNVQHLMLCAVLTVLMFVIYLFHRMMRYPNSNQTPL